MSDLSSSLPEFARDRAIVLRDLNEKQARGFEAWTEEQRQRELDRISQIMREANDLPAYANLQGENVAVVNPDLAEMQKQLERNGAVVASQPSPENRIKNARDR